MVRLRGTRGDSPNLLEWDHGQYEGKEGKALGVLDTMSVFIPRTAAKLPMVDGESLIVPSIYLCQCHQIRSAKRWWHSMGGTRGRL